jgi:hypothetical protein
MGQNMTNSKERSDVVDWQIIDTAPKNGTRVRLLSVCGEDFGFYDAKWQEWSTELGNGEPLLWART